MSGSAPAPGPTPATVVHGCASPAELAAVHQALAQAVSTAAAARPGGTGLVADLARWRRARRAALDRSAGTDD